MENNNFEFYSFTKIIIFKLKRIGKETLINMIQKMFLKMNHTLMIVFIKLLIKYHFYYYSYQFKKNFC